MCKGGLYCILLVITGISVISSAAMHRWELCWTILIILLSAMLKCIATGQEGLHLRDGSSHCEIIGAKVHDTGLAGSYGEAIYIGSAKSTSGYVHEFDNNLVKGCVLGPNVTDELIDIKEYTTGNIIEDCTMYGEGMTAQTVLLILRAMK